MQEESESSATRPMAPKPLRLAGAILALGLLSIVIHHLANRVEPVATPPVVTTPAVETIPPGIIVTETSSGLPVPSPGVAGSSPGDAIIAGYAAPSSDARQDLVLLSRSLGNFLLLDKTASARPLSANAEWSKALSGQRGGAGPWFTPSAPVWNDGGLLVDRWKNPLHFHALGGGKWEIRSNGPDGLPYSADDIVEPLAGR